MKKNLIAAAFAATAVLSASNVFAAAGTVNFIGEILEVGCTVSISAQGQNVELGKYSKNEFTIAGDTTTAQKFNIVLTACPASVTSARVLFDGTPDATDSSLLAVDSSVAGAAKGVAIKLMTADKQTLGLNADNGYRYTLSSTESNTLNYYAQYKSTSATVTSGPANAVANFSVVYN